MTSKKNLQTHNTNVTDKLSDEQKALFKEEYDKFKPKKFAEEDKPWIKLHKINFCSTLGNKKINLKKKRKLEFIGLRTDERILSF